MNFVGDHVPALGGLLASNVVVAIVEGAVLAAGAYGTAKITRRPCLCGVPTLTKGDVDKSAFLRAFVVCTILCYVQGGMAFAHVYVPRAVVAAAAFVAVLMWMSGRSTSSSKRSVRSWGGPARRRALYPYRDPVLAHLRADHVVFERRVGAEAPRRADLLPCSTGRSRRSASSRSARCSTSARTGERATGRAAAVAREARPDRSPGWLLRRSARVGRRRTVVRLRLSHALVDPLVRDECAPSSWSRALDALAAHGENESDARTAPTAAAKNGAATAQSRLE